jgi:hypothetical protein
MLAQREQYPPEIRLAQRPGHVDPTNRHLSANASRMSP